jgi:hypothetical protein
MVNLPAPYVEVATLALLIVINASEIGLLVFSSTTVPFIIPFWAIAKEQNKVNKIDRYNFILFL